jgi:hypothetical protein
MGKSRLDHLYAHAADCICIQRISLLLHLADEALKRIVERACLA